VKPLSVDPYALLRAFSWARLVVAALLVGVGPWASAVVIPTASAGLLLTVFALVVVSSGTLLLVGPGSRPRVVAWLMCVLDAALITAVVGGTGGPRSILVFLYVPLVTAACVLLSRDGALGIAGLASVLYATLILMRTLVPVLAFDAPADATMALDVLAILVNSGTLAVVAFVSGGLADHFLSSQRELESQRQSFSDLRAFRDVIFESAGTGLVALGRDHRITAFNHAAEMLTGVAARIAVGARWPELFGGALPLDEIEAAVTAAPETSTRHEIELTRPDGTLAPVRVTGSALVAGDGTRLGLIIACDDLSALRSLETRMRQADRLATLGRMAANIAHEIRNPLASLTGAVEALTVPGATADTRTRLTEIVVRESNRLSEIIRNFLEYARPTSLKVEAIDLTELLDEVLRAVSPRLAEGGVKVVRALPRSLLLEADRERLREALWSLCLNAAAAMPAGGELRITATALGGMVEMTFTDTGERLLPHELPHVFEPFFAVRNGAGGLGLALVHRIAQEHGGEATARSRRAVGAEFTLHLPERYA
jgi:two-component system sensor histidine kinase PilS (NtrC family)